MKRYQQLLELFLKHTPETNQAITKKQFDQAQFCQMSDRDIDPYFRYIDSLQIHKEYLDFFQIGVFRDQRSKI